MKKIIFSAFLLSTLLTTENVLAQISVGPKIGLNLSKLHGNDEAEISDAKTKVGFQVGGMLNAQINDYFTIRPELIFSTLGAKFNHNGYKTSVNTNYISLPVNFVGQYPISDNFKIQVLVGPYISYGLGGKVKHEDQFNNKEEDKIKMKKVPTQSSSYSEYLNPLDLGLNIGLGFQAKSFIFSASYAFGFTNLEPHYENSQFEDERGENGKIYNRNITFGVSYLFGGK